MSLTVYGIKNCDTVKKARRWLEEEGVEHRFHDFRKDGFDSALVSKLEAGLGWEALLNTRGTTWRKLDDADKADMNSDKAQALMAAHDAIIKRPVWEKAGDFRLGFAAKDQEQIKAWAKG
jgi:arsenate reductase